MSPNAKTCPGCGEEKPASGNAALGLLGIFIIIFLWNTTNAILDFLGISFWSLVLIIIFGAAFIFFAGPLIGEALTKLYKRHIEETVYESILRIAFLVPISCVLVALSIFFIYLSVSLGDWQPMIGVVCFVGASALSIHALFDALSELRQRRNQ